MYLSSRYESDYDVDLPACLLLPSLSSIPPLHLLRVLPLLLLKPTPHVISALLPMRASRCLEEARTRCATGLPINKTTQTKALVGGRGSGIGRSDSASNPHLL